MAKDATGAQLLEFLLSAYTVQEMTTLLHNMGLVEVLHDAPSSESSAKGWFFGLTLVLERRALIGDLLREVAEDRPRLRPQISRLIALYRPKESTTRLPWVDVERLLEAALAAGLDEWNRQFALQDRADPSRVPMLLCRDASANLRATLEVLNRRTEDSMLARWIEAAREAAPVSFQELFAFYEDVLRPQPEPSPAVRLTPPAFDIGDARHSSTIEQLVPFSFLLNGHRAGASIASVRFLQSRKDRGVLSAADRFQGTGVLIAPRLLLTSWYLANAENFGGGRDDFLLQCRTASFRFDVDGEHNTGELVLSGGAVAWNGALNVVLLRIPDDLQRPPAVLRTAPLAGDEPLSVIQHPLAGRKRVSLRDLRGYTVLDTTVRYNGDVRVAFAGAPWFDDAWQIVALQGKVSYPRPGEKVHHHATPATAILDALRRGDFEVPPGGDPAAVVAELARSQPALAEVEAAAARSS